VSDARDWCGKEIDKHRERIEAALRAGSKDGRQDFLGVSPVPRAIAATDFACYDRGPKRLLSAPVGGVDVGIQQERQDAGEFPREMRGEPVDGWQPAVGVDQPIEAVPQLPACDRDPMRRHGAGVAAVAHLQRVRENRRHVARERRARMLKFDRPTASEQMIQARLPHRVGEVPIRRPPIAHEGAGEVGHWSAAPTRQPVSSGTTTALVRTVSISAA